MIGVRLTGRGATVLVLGLSTLGVGMWWRYPGLAGLGVAFLGLLVTSVLAVSVRAPVEARRSVTPREVARTGTCTGTLEVARAGGVLPVELAASEQVGDLTVSVAVPPLAADATTTVTYAIPTERRGILRVGPLRLDRRGTAGLAFRSSEVGDPVPVRVRPRTLPVGGMPRGVARGHVGADERAEHGGTDLVGLHEYVPGDDLRRLHWATSARTGTLMVRDDADPSRPHVVVVLDDRADRYDDPGTDFEEAADVAASLAAAAATIGHPVHLLTVSGAVDLVTDGTTDGSVDRSAPTLIDALVEVTPRDGASPLATIATRDLDVVAVVTGTGAVGDAADPLLLEVGRAAAGVVLVVDAAPRRTTEVIDRVTVLRGARAEDLVAGWDRVVVGAPR